MMSSSTIAKTANGANISLHKQALNLLMENKVCETYELSMQIDMDQQVAAESSSTLTRRTKEVYQQGKFSTSSMYDDSRKLSNITSNFTFTFPSPCKCARSVQESTSTLMAARAFAKAGNSDFAWESLDSLFSTQAPNGFLPRWRYSPPSKHNNSTNYSYYVNGTTIPNWPLFGRKLSARYVPANTTLAHRIGMKHSGRISAIPLHATAVLEIFYQSNQTDKDLSALQRNFDRIFMYHYFLHEIVMRGCSENTHNDHATSAPCYNVIHPWETLVEMSSDLWEFALDDLQHIIATNGWMVGFNIPMQVKDAFDYPREENVYNSAVYLLQCVANATSECQPLHFGVHRHDSECEDFIISRCPFALLDVGYAAALSRSDADLLEMSKILIEKHGDKQTMDKSKSLTSKTAELMKWKAQSDRILSQDLWSSNHQTFLSKSLVFQAGENETFVSNTTKALVTPVANNFMACWGSNQHEPAKVGAMSFHMLQNEGKFSFDCGPFPLWSMGFCNKKDNNWKDNRHRRIVHPMVNYLVSRGMADNNNAGISHYLSQATLNLVCGTSNEEPMNGTTDNNYCATNNLTFQSAYDGAFGLPIGLSDCDSSYTESAAVVYNLIVPDKPFHYSPAPPIRSSWVIFLVTVELVVAFSIGVTCLIFSLNLMRRLKYNTEGDNFVRELNSRDISDMFDTDIAYFSAAESVASDADSGPADGSSSSLSDDDRHHDHSWSGPSPFRAFSRRDENSDC